MVSHTLTVERIAMIAEMFGVSVESIQRDVAQAISAHGHSCKSMGNDKSIVSWGTNEYGIYDAEKLLIGYIEQNEMDRRIDERDYAEHCERAYG